MPPANPKSKGRSKRQAASDSEDEGPLPKVTYATLKERQIKDLLQQHQLSVQGDRATLEQRHKK
jgi:E3 ubiquitin-protein ligase RAD18